MSFGKVSLSLLRSLERKIRASRSTIWNRPAGLSAFSEESARHQGVGECDTGLLLQLAIQVDEQIAAGDEVDAGEGRVLEQAVRCKQKNIAHFALDAVVVALAIEKPSQALF